MIYQNARRLMRVVVTQGGRTRQPILRGRSFVFRTFDANAVSSPRDSPGKNPRQACQGARCNPPRRRKRQPHAQGAARFGDAFQSSRGQFVGRGARNGRSSPSYSWGAVGRTAIWAARAHAAYAHAGTMGNGGGRGLRIRRVPRGRRSRSDELIRGRAADLVRSTPMESKADVTLPP